MLPPNITSIIDARLQILEIKICNIASVKNLQGSLSCVFILLIAEEKKKATGKKILMGNAIFSSARCENPCNDTKFLLHAHNAAMSS